MAKRQPEQRWRDYELERLADFERSRDRVRLRSKGLRLLGRRTCFSWEEWFPLHRQVDREAVRAYYMLCRPIAARWGLAEYVVAGSAIVRGGYQAARFGWGPPIVSTWPCARLIVGADAHPDFVAWLVHAVHVSPRARTLGLRVVQAMDGRDVTLISIPFPVPPDAPLSPATRPPRDLAFTLRVETSPLYPPEAAAEVQRLAQHACRDVLRRLGYDVPQRLRRSTVAQDAGDKLRLGRARRRPRESGDIAEDMYGEGAALDRQLRRRVVKQRNAVSDGSKTSGKGTVALWGRPAP